MPCYRPVDVPKRGFADLRITVACGRCIGCRLEKTRQWATRCVHEASQHEANCFVTFTYAKEHLPYGGTLDKTHFPAFMKRLRKAQSHYDEFGNLWARPIRFFMSGEYGDDDHRPHYHAILFNYYPQDALLARPASGRKEALYTSKSLDRLWGKGFCWVGQVSYKSAGYTARYIVKKVTGDLADEHYRTVDLETGEVHQLLPEFALMSRRTGIGKGWFQQFHSDLYPDDFTISEGRKNGKPPAYYDKLLKRRDAAAHEAVKAKRTEKLNEPKLRANSTPARLAVREEVKTRAVSLHKRNLT
ncbi:MAG: replication initiator protein [Microvirus sp.]|nr:MAG: replication initiator protein [Microvirus sp.]